LASIPRHQQVQLNNLTAEFTKYRPHPNVRRLVGPDQKDGLPICLPQDPNRPVHLYLAGIYLLYGGMQLAKVGNSLLAPGEIPYLHQMAHSDFASPQFNFLANKNDNAEDFPLASQSPLLRGLSHPATINVALETERTMWINYDKHVVTFKKNEAVANSADTIHGGVSWNAHNHKDDQGRFLYKPSLHMVLGSVRFPQIPNNVKINVSDSTYCPSEHTPWMSDEELKSYLTVSGTRMLQLVAIAKGELGQKHEAVCEECHDIIDAVEKGFGLSAIQNVFKKPTKAKDSKRSAVNNTNISKKPRTGVL
jgi:hypothetical protein